MKKFLWMIVLTIFIIPSVAIAGDIVGYDGGFYIKNTDDTFKLTINGRVQPKFQIKKESLNNNKDVTFLMRRASINFKATIYEKFSAGFGLIHATNSEKFSSVEVSGAEAAYTHSPELRIAAGMEGLPLSLIGAAGSSWLLLNNSPIVIIQEDGIEDYTIPRSSFSAPAGLGLNISGDIWKLSYEVGVVNGNEDDYSFNPENLFSFGGRLQFNALGSVPILMTDYDCTDKPAVVFNVGSMYQAKKDYYVGAGNTTNPTVVKYMWTSTLGGGFHWGGFAFTTEGFYRRTHVTAPGAAAWARSYLTDIGYYGAAGYYIIPKKFEVALQAGQVFRQGPDNNSNSFGGGLNYYIHGNNLKLQLSYIWTEDYDDMWGAANNNQKHDISLMLMASF